jgi:hypothetical protein
MFRGATAEATTDSDSPQRRRQIPRSGGDRFPATAVATDSPRRRWRQIPCYGGGDRFLAMAAVAADSR